MLGDFAGGLDILAALITLLYMGKLLFWDLYNEDDAFGLAEKRSLLNQRIMPRQI